MIRRPWLVVDTRNGKPFTIRRRTWFAWRAHRIANFYNGLTRARTDAQYRLEVIHRDECDLIARGDR